MDKDEILFTYLYGSFLKSKSYNDIDIGIYVSKNYETNTFYEIEIGNEFENLLGKESFDIRILNGRSLRFLFNMLKNSSLIFSRNDKERVKLDSMIMKQYLDIKPFYEYYNKMRELRYGINKDLLQEKNPTH
ncbi:MAG: hypothetical protein EU547_06515 [Promethearchaeota archaeon]|nr:MAG: hypothetical protein EU547_06515 [Candidatus Lokiarchaeota archaeon]